MVDWLIKAAAVTGALSTIGTTAWAVIKFVIKPIAKVLHEIKILSEKVETLGNHDHDNYLSLLRLSLVSEEMPMEERLEAGRKYVAAGGNGPAKALYKILLEQYETELKQHRKEDIL